jgi:hypothetical protein
MSNYTININCMNCDAPNALQIPQGTTVSDFKKEETKCSNCGCSIYPVTVIPKEEVK